MADEPTESELAEARLIIAAACAAAGRAENIPAWKGRVNTLIPEAAAMFGSRSNQVRRALMMQAATVFTAEYIGFELEQTSQRYKVSLRHAVDGDHPDGVQVIRTERSDTGAGRAMLAHLENVREGNTLLCWKTLEEMKGRGGRKAAVLMHVETLPDRPKDADDRPFSDERRPAPPGPAPSLPVPGGAPDVQAAVSEWQREMGPPRFVAAVHRCRAEGVWPATEANFDRVLMILTEEKSKGA